MITLPFLADKKVAVIGLGKSGHAVVDALQLSGADVLVWDDGAPDKSTAPYESWDWSQIDLMVLSPGVPYTHPKPHGAVMMAQQHDVPVVGEVELLYRAQPDATYIAITGTNGKSTTTSLIAHILSEAGRSVQVGGNLGVPSLALEPLGKGGIYVLELSSYQCDLLRSTKFDVGVLLNFSPDHLDRHGDMEGYIAAKDHMFERMDQSDVMVIGVDDAYSEALCRGKISEARAKVIPIATTQTAGNGIWVGKGALHNPLGVAEQVADLLPIKNLQGVHNHQNAAAAYAACWSVGLRHDEIMQGMQSYGGLAHRMQRVGEQDGVLYINDSKATNADAAAKSLETFDDIYWILGGVSKEGGITSLAHYFPKVKHAFLIGAASDEFAATLQGHVPYTRSGTLAQACADAFAMAKQGVVLLAPACASFDQFANFEQRGDMFSQFVREYVQDREGSHEV